MDAPLGGIAAEHQALIAIGTIVTSFDEYTFHAPREGLFVGDKWLPAKATNLISLFYFHKELGMHRQQSPLAEARLAQLPLEILHLILSQLDICSLVAFAGTSTLCRRAVLSLHLFEAVAGFPRLLGTLLYMRCRFVSFATLAACVGDTRCKRCGHFGDVMYLMAPERACYPCWRLDRTKKVLLVPKAKLKLSDEAIRAGVPHIRIPPGTYGPRGRGVLQQPRIAFERVAFTDKFGLCLQEEETKHFGADSTEEPHILNYVGSIRAPYFDDDTQSWEEGFFCRACAFHGEEHTQRSLGPTRINKDGYSAWGLPWRRYTRAGMHMHIQQYGPILKLPEADGSWFCCSAHESSFSTWFTEADYAMELVRIGRLLHSLRNKEYEFPQLQPFLPQWYWNSGLYILAAIT